MATTSSIEWTEATWNPVTGCTKISAGCKYCYAERMAHRLQAMGTPQYRDGFKLTLQPETLETPLKWLKPRIIFVNSMSDLFHKLVPTDYIRRVFDVMNRSHWHTFQILTKRPERVASIASELNWTPNIWMGTSIEDERVLARLQMLKRIPARIRFLSLEPLLGPLPILDLIDIHWVIVGGESGPKSRPMDKQWVFDVHRQCERNNVPFFFKQWGGTNKKKAGRTIEGRTWDEMPAHAQPEKVRLSVA